MYFEGTAYLKKITIGRAELLSYSFIIDLFT